jgi:large subunit ribosomal protein L22
VRIHPQRLTKQMADRGATPESLAPALARKGLSRERAESAIRNWMKGRDHPRCKPEDIRALAGQLGCSVPDLVRFVSVYKYHRGSPRKARLLADLIRGKSVVEAENLLTFTPKRAAVDVKKALVAARTDAELADADVGSLVVAISTVDEGPAMKRFQPKDRGRAHPILKKMSHITIGLEEKA